MIFYHNVRVRISRHRLSTTSISSKDSIHNNLPLGSTSLRFQHFSYQESLVNGQKSMSKLWQGYQLICILPECTDSLNFFFQVSFTYFSLFNYFPGNLGLFPMYKMGYHLVLHLQYDDLSGTYYFRSHRL